MSVRRSQKSLQGGHVQWLRWTVLAMIVFYLGMPATGVADFDPPAPPAIKEHVELLSVEIEYDGDTDGPFSLWSDAGTIQISSTVTQPNHGQGSGPESHQYGVYHPNDKDANTKTIAINQPIYRHVECTPREEPLDITFKVTELDTTGPETVANVSTTVRGDDPGKVLRENGKATFTFSVTTSPVPAHDAKCAPGQPRQPSPQIAMLLEPAHPFATAGATTTVAIAMANVTNQSVTYRLALEPLANRKTLPSPATWSLLSQSEVTIPPGETAQFSLTINVPKDTPKKDYPFQLVAYAKEPVDNQVEFIILSVTDWPIQVTRPYQTEAEARAEDRIQALIAGLAVIVFLIVMGTRLAKRTRNITA